MILQCIKTRNGSSVAFIIDKGNGVRCIQKYKWGCFGLVPTIPIGCRTSDPNGKVIAQGNVLASLIADLL